MYLCVVCTQVCFPSNFLSLLYPLRGSKKSHHCSCNLPATTVTRTVCCRPPSFSVLSMGCLVEKPAPESKYTFCAMPRRAKNTPTHNCIHYPDRTLPDHVLLTLLLSCSLALAPSRPRAFLPIQNHLHLHWKLHSTYPSLPSPLQPIAPCPSPSSRAQSP